MLVMFNNFLYFLLNKESGLLTSLTTLQCYGSEAEIGTVYCVSSKRLLHYLRALVILLLR